MISALLLAFAQAPNDPYFPTWGQEILRLEEAWTVTKGSHARPIAHLDTGWNPHVDLGWNVIDQIDLVDGALPAQDTLGHGTAILSLLAANTDNGIGVAGTAPNAGVIVVRGGASGMTQAMATDALREALQQTDAKVFLIEQQAYGWNSPQWRSALRRAARAGTVICAAGNQGGFIPGLDNPDLIVVAGSSSDGFRWPFSNYGPVVDISAPASGWLTYYQDGNGDGLVNDYYGASGTSVSCAYVAGIAALVWASEDGLTPAEVRTKILGPDLTGNWVRHVADAARSVGL